MDKTFLLDRALQIADEIETFRLCGPSDDPDEQTGVVYGLKFLAKKFIGAAKSIDNPGIKELLSDVNANITDIYGAYDLHADLFLVIAQLRLLKEHPEIALRQTTQEVFVELETLNLLRTANSGQYDLTKVAEVCEEINAAYSQGHYISVALLIRTILNHIPPLFKATTFKEVVGSSSRSVKPLIEPLENIARNIADHHTHALISQRETLPTKAQVGPSKAGFEILLQEAVKRASPP